MNIKVLSYILIIFFLMSSCNLDQTKKVIYEKEKIIEIIKKNKVEFLPNFKDIIVNDSPKTYIYETKFKIKEKFNRISNFIWGNKDENNLYFIYTKGASENNRIDLILYNYDVKYNIFSKIGSIFYIEADKIRQNAILSYIGGINLNFDDEYNTFLYYDDNKGIIKKKFNENSEYLLNLRLLDSSSLSRNLKYKIYIDKADMPVIKDNYENKSYFINIPKNLFNNNNNINFILNSDKYINLGLTEEKGYYNFNNIFNIETNEVIKIPKLDIPYDTLNEDIYYFSDKILKYNIKEKKITDLGNYINKKANIFYDIKLSRNGRYISYIGAFGEKEKHDWKRKLVIFNIETKEEKILDIEELENSESVDMFEIAI